MAGANNDRNDDHRQPRDVPEDPSTRASRHSDGVFHSIWSLPSTIYQRGNEHGREFNRMYNERWEQREQQREAEGKGEDQGRGRACGWRGRRHWRERRQREEEEQQARDEKMMDDWVGRVVRELERGEEQAKEMYEMWNRMGGVEQNSAPEPVRQEPKNEAVKKESTWADIFPAWSSEAKGNGNSHEHVFGREARSRPLTSAARGVEDTIDKLHEDFGRILGDAEQWRQFFHRGVQRDARLWEEEGLFGPSVPFSKPLSTMFSMGMRPFLPKDSAMGYLLYSEYSPLHLEHEDGFDASFRDRFEDLLKTQNGGNLETTQGQRHVGTQVEWIGRIVPLLKESEDGSTGSVTIGSTSDRQQVVQVEEHYEHAPRTLPLAGLQTTNEGYQGPHTEMDMYEQQVGFPRSEQPTTMTPRSTVETSKPSILSTMTTTERHVAQDGSVTTKTVLQKRFADGTEESSETVETTPMNGPTAWARQQIGDQQFREANAASESKIIKETKRGRGWFWSS